MPISYPLDLRTVIRASKAREQPATFRMAEPRRGYGYAEAIGTDVPVFWSVTFRFTQAEAAIFRRWFVGGINRGVDEFLLPIRTEFGLQTYTVRFLPEGLLPLREAGEIFEYSATIMARSEIVPAGYVDPAFGSVVLLAHLSDDFADTSTFARAPTPSGPPTFDGTVPLFGTNAASFGGSVSYPDAASLDIGTQAFTIEGWLYLAALPGGTGVVVSHSQTTNFNFNSHEFIVYVTNIGTIGISVGRPSSAETKSETGLGTVPVGAWFHWAFCRGGDSLEAYVDGARLASATLLDAVAITQSPAPLIIGAAGPDSGGYAALTCRQREVRHTIGARRYTGPTLVVPTAPFTDY